MHHHNKREKEEEEAGVGFSFKIATLVLIQFVEREWNDESSSDEPVSEAVKWLTEEKRFSSSSSLHYLD